jgi:ABC-type glycerol-3-phosphate transport system permease component
MDKAMIQPKAISKQVIARQPERHIRWDRVVVLGGLGAFCVFNLLVFAWVLVISFKTTTEFLTTSPWSLPGRLVFENYALAWQRANIGTYFFNSIFVASFGAAGSVLVSALVAYVITKINFRGRDLVERFFSLGFMISMVMTIVPMYYVLTQIGLSEGFKVLIPLYVAMGISFNTVLLRGYFETLPNELEEAAAIDGASPFRTFWQIVLPLARPGLVSAFLINFLSCWNEFFLALIFLRSKDSTLPLGLYSMAQRAEYTAQWTDLFAGLIIASLPVLILFGLLQNQIERGMTAGAIKG